VGDGKRKDCFFGAALEFPPSKISYGDCCKLVTAKCQRFAFPVFLLFTFFLFNCRTKSLL
jgi:hypothetical protein